MNLKIIDALIGAGSGAIIAFTVSQLIPAGWNMFLAMAAGGGIGMVLKFVLLLLLAPFFGAFEVMIPLSIIAMAVGMLSGMVASQGVASVVWISATGAISGFAVSAAVYFSNRKLTRV